MHLSDPPSTGPSDPAGPPSHDADGTRLVPCPRCGRPARFSRDNRWRPFCSERCRTGDLGDWANERWRVPAVPVDGDDADATVPPASDQR